MREPRNLYSPPHRSRGFAPAFGSSKSDESEADENACDCSVRAETSMPIFSTAHFPEEVQLARPNTYSLGHFQDASHHNQAKRDV